jgi:AcrR family transcriptional regulator
LELVAEVGPQGFSLAEVTRRAGVSVAAPYKHFADRDALLAALAERGYDQQLRLFAAAIDSAREPVDQLAAFAAAYVRFAVRERPLFEITFRSGLDKSRYPALEAAGARVLATLDVPARQLRAGPEASNELIYAVAAASHGLALFHLERVFPKGSDSLAATVKRAADAARLLATPPAS